MLLDVVVFTGTENPGTTLRPIPMIHWISRYAAPNWVESPAQDTLPRTHSCRASGSHLASQPVGMVAMRASVNLEQRDDRCSCPLVLLLHGSTTY